MSTGSIDSKLRPRKPLSAARLLEHNADKPSSVFGGLSGLIGVLGFGFRHGFEVGLLLVSLCSILLGAHGIYVYLSRYDIFIEGKAEQLFLGWNIPGPFSRAIEWSSLVGSDSWLVPAIVMVAGLVLWLFQGAMQMHPSAWNWPWAGLALTGVFAVIIMVFVGVFPHDRVGPVEVYGKPYIELPQSEVHFDLKPNGMTLPEKTYIVELYQNDRFVDTASVQWSASELENGDITSIRFPLLQSRDETCRLDGSISQAFRIRIVE